jgi:hypothetical protein
MFGLMKRRCGESCGTDKENYRLHYCGTCKSMGSIYGQKSRIFLNFDAVFLSELLSALSSENTNDWQKGYQSHNCFSKIDEAEIPLVLQYSAAVNVFLTELKTLDHVHDENKWWWKTFRFSYRSSFRKSVKNLSQFGLDTDEVYQIFNQQFSLEKEQNKIEKYALPTAKITSIIFEKGGDLVQRNKAELKEIGFYFGQIAYLLDALEDYEKDYHSNSFNGIKNAFKLNESTLPNNIKAIVHEQINSKQQALIKLIHLLDLPEQTQQIFTSRLALNISALLYQKEQKEANIIPLPSWKNSQQKAREIVQNITNPIQRRIQYASISLALFVQPETLDTFKEMDLDKLGIAATIAAASSAFACYAGKKRKRILRRLKRLRKGQCFECNPCGSCSCLDCFSGCCEGSVCENCCDQCQKDCNRECNKCLKFVLWTLVALLIIGILILIIVLIT